MGSFIDWYGDGSVVVEDLSLACCAVESEFAVPRGAARVPAVPEGAHLVQVVSGTPTDAIVDVLIERLHEEHPAARSRTRVAFGACAIAGGPYWDSWSVTKGVDQVAAIDHYIPGCPPPPQALSSYVDRVRTL
ncbi:MAG TPA: proton-conducting membrane transporter [Propionibacteriaceae bacterium]|nr:proton-conducting membrane transporter [Propionibacteriaceae bacterium]